MPSEPAGYSDACYHHQRLLCYRTPDSAVLLQQKRLLKHADAAKVLSARVIFTVTSEQGLILQSTNTV
jgi:hypothetical protein